MTDAVDTGRLSALWDERWPGCSKMPFEVLSIRDRSVRFHALPGSKRYPDTEDEYGIVMHRHNTILAELTVGSSLLVVTAGYSPAAEPTEDSRAPETIAAQRSAIFWTAVLYDDEPGSECWMHLYVDRTEWARGRLDPLLRLVADDVVSDILLADLDLRWLYHPYDGGMDVAVSSASERDALRERHSVWLSAHPNGT